MSDALQIPPEEPATAYLRSYKKDWTAELTVLFVLSFSLYRYAPSLLLFCCRCSLCQCPLSSKSLIHFISGLSTVCKMYIFISGLDFFCSRYRYSSSQLLTYSILEKELHAGALARFNGSITMPGERNKNN